MSMKKQSIEKVRRWRTKKAKEGGRSLSVWLEPETARLLDEIRQTNPEAKMKEIVRVAIEQLYEVTCSQTKPTAPKMPRRSLREVFDEVLDNTRDGVPLKKYRPALKRFCKHELNSAGKSYADVARYFNSISLKTFSGQKWKVTDIKTLVD